MFVGSVEVDKTYIACKEFASQHNIRLLDICRRMAVIARRLSGKRLTCTMLIAGHGHNNTF